MLTANTASLRAQLDVPRDKQRVSSRTSQDRPASRQAGTSTRTGSQNARPQAQSNPGHGNGHTHTTPRQTNSIPSSVAARHGDTPRRLPLAAPLPSSQPRMPRAAYHSPLGQRRRDPTLPSFRVSLQRLRQNGFPNCLKRRQQDIGQLAVNPRLNAS